MVNPRGVVKRRSLRWRCPYCGKTKAPVLFEAHLLAEEAIAEYDAFERGSDSHPAYVEHTVAMKGEK
jgi:hypothetical protein